MNEELDIVEGDVLGLLECSSIITAATGRGDRWAAALESARCRDRGACSSSTRCAASRRNVAHHYDLSGELYGLFLDQDLQYSCAYFERPDMTLEEAQLAKKRHIAAKLASKPARTVLDIGSGWGGLGLYLARTFDVDVTGVTLSTEQHLVADRRARRGRA